MPSVSVVVPIFQVEPYIEASIRSVCAQSFRDFEVVLVDDGTRDRSVEIAASLLAGAGVIYRTVRQENRGLAAARNSGLSQAQGEWVIFIDADDCIHPRMLEIMLDSAGGADAVCCSFAWLDSQSEDLPIAETYETERLDRKALARTLLLRDKRMVITAFLTRREFLIGNGLRFDEKCRFSEDQAFMWELMRCSHDFRYVPLRLYGYFLRPGSIMTASGVEKIMTGYRAFSALSKRLAPEETELGIPVAQVLPRWVLGTLHSSAKMLAYTDYSELSEQMDYRACAKAMRRFSDLRIAALACVLSVSRRLFYAVSRRI